LSSNYLDEKKLKSQSESTTCHPLIHNTLSLSAICSFTHFCRRLCYTRQFSQTKMQCVTICSRLQQCWVNSMSLSSSSSLNTSLHNLHLLKVSLNTFIAHGLIIFSILTRSTLKWHAICVTIDLKKKLKRHPCIYWIKKNKGNWKTQKMKNTHSFLYLFSSPLVMLLLPGQNWMLLFYWHITIILPI